MKKILLLCVLSALCSHGAACLWAATDPGDQFLEAYFLIQEADAAARQTDRARAASKYDSALQILTEIKAKAPDWNPHIIEFRINYCNEHLDALKPHLAPPAPPAPVPAPPQPEPLPEAPLPAPALAVDTEQIRQLSFELQRARDQIRQLEAARDSLNAQLQQALSKIAPTETTPQIEELLKLNQDLAAQLAAAQTEIASLREQAAAIPAPPAAPAPTEPAELARLRAQLAEARSDLQRAKQELQQTRLELDDTRKQLTQARAENLQLRRSYDEVAAQLADANRRLAAAQAASAKDDEIIHQLRKENALLRLIVDRRAIATRQPQPAETRPAIPELKGWRPRRRPPPVAKVEQQKLPPPAAMVESGRGRLVATLTAPPPPAEQEPPKEAPAAARPQPQPAAPAPAPAPAVTSQPAPAPPPASPPTPPRAATPQTRALLNEARAAVELKDLDTAAAKYEAVLAVEPDNLQALTNLGVVRYQQGRLEQAEQLMRKAVLSAPNDSASRSLLGVIHFRRGLLEEAFSELTRAVALDPRNAEAHNYLGIVLSEKGWSAAAEQQVRRAIELNPQYADAHFNMAVIYSKLRTPRLELARYHYKKALDLGAAPDPQLESLLNIAPQTPLSPEPQPAAQQ